MTALSPELHYNDASLDDMKPENFRVYFRLMAPEDQQELAANLEERFHAYARMTIKHHDQAALGISADHDGLTPEIRARRERIGNVLIDRERQLEKIQVILGIALGETVRLVTTPEAITEAQVVLADTSAPDAIPLPDSAA